MRSWVAVVVVVASWGGGGGSSKDAGATFNRAGGFDQAPVALAVDEYERLWVGGRLSAYTDQPVQNLARFEGSLGQIDTSFDRRGRRRRREHDVFEHPGGLRPADAGRPRRQPALGGLAGDPAPRSAGRDSAGGPGDFLRRAFPRAPRRAVARGPRWFAHPDAECVCDGGSAAPFGPAEGRDPCGCRALNGARKNSSPHGVSVGVTVYG